ncbi:MAG TPA: ABC transporter ATP-binding protein [Acidimicrobiales bacterium]|nr:ABC transporter ATP-binding protein [Acidimicrobiales bacterium]
MSSTIAVEVHDVSKRFRLYHEKYQSLKERVLHAGSNPHEDFWALRNISFDIAEGETIGVLGRNGSGKSTLLKCISGILQPTDGRVLVRGQLAALLELGAGFQPELSGRENIFLNASLLGISRRDIERRFDEIVAFAELEQFIDNQVKFYSSGMYVRLGFAVAVNVDPDILVVDEVLAVGDENFQRKCMARIKEFQEEGRTILFVTHAADLVRQICDQAVVLDGGQMLFVGDSAEAVRLYHDHLLVGGPGLGASPEGPEGEGPPVLPHRPVLITSVEIDHPGVGERTHILPWEPLAIHVAFDAKEPVEGLVFGIDIHDSGGGLVFATDTEIVGRLYDAPAGPGRADLRFDQVPILDGSYTIKVEIRNRLGIVFDTREQPGFEVMNPGRARGTLALQLHADVRAASLS